MPPHPRPERHERCTFDPPLDYAAVGLISGLEVHQQLLTDRKLFCHCPAGRYTRTHDGTVLRHMRPTLSELGVYDGTALMEFKTRKHIIYLLNRENTCTYEMDDTPPFPVNQEAVDVAIEQCLMLGCDIVDEVHIARKQYLDGSIPTGFQRTAIVGVNGKLPFRGRELSITQVSVEEDSCREVSDQRPPDRLAHRPARHAAHRDGDRPRPADARRGRGGDPARRPGLPLDAATCASAWARAGRT